MYTEELKKKLELKLSNSICSASDALTDLGKLPKASVEEIKRLAEKYGISLK